MPLELALLLAMLTRILRQYIFRIEFVFTFMFVWLIWIYFNWLTDNRYQRFLAGKKSVDEVLLPYTTWEPPGKVQIVGWGDLPTPSPSIWSYKRDEVSYYAARGGRPYMEDRMSVLWEDTDTKDISIYGLYDGHGGQFVSDFAEKAFVKGLMQRILNEKDTEDTDISKLMLEEILALDSNILKASGPPEDLIGSTLLTALLYKGRYLTIGNVGDSRGVLCDMNGKAFYATVEHKPDSEKEKQRIEAAGGWISWLGVWRVAGVLATSRALGDGQLKKLGYLTAMPDIQTIDLKEKRSKFLILASDGLWDVIGADEACDMVRKSLITRKDTLFGAKKLVELAIKRISMDNVSVMVVTLPTFSQDSMDSN